MQRSLRGHEDNEPRGRPVYARGSETKSTIRMKGTYSKIAHGGAHMKVFMLNTSSANSEEGNTPITVPIPPGMHAPTSQGVER